MHAPNRRNHHCRIQITENGTGLTVCFVRFSATLLRLLCKCTAEGLPYLVYISFLSPCSSASIPWRLPPALPVPLHPFSSSTSTPLLPSQPPLCPSLSHYVFLRSPFPLSLPFPLPVALTFHLFPFDLALSHSPFVLSSRPLMFPHSLCALAALMAKGTAIPVQDSIALFATRTQANYYVPLYSCRVTRTGVPF